MANMRDEIGPVRRELYFKVIDSHPATLVFHEVAGKVHFLDESFPKEKIDAALKWLIQNRITGAAFVDWFKNECQNSLLEMHKRLLSAVEKTEIKILRAGENFRV